MFAEDPTEELWLFFDSSWLYIGLPLLRQTLLHYRVVLDQHNASQIYCYRDIKVCNVQIANVGENWDK